ncbi:MAG: Holliday junction branch migration protein RuvA [Methylovirgula sp.]|jgi:Holliday junction DNA helicase RuvA
MIGKLSGTIDSIGEDFIIIDVHGVGYVVHCSARTLSDLPRVGEVVSLAIETHVREDAIKLYGFTSEAERDWFRLLQTVQGVGAKVALAVLGSLSVDELATAIVRQDKAQIARAPGIGPRLAARLAAELKDKVPASLSLRHGVAQGAVEGAVEEAEPAAAQDAVAALLTLGYARGQAADAIEGARRRLGEAADTAALVRQALRQLSR